MPPQPGALEETGPIRTGFDELDDACGKFHERVDDGLAVMNKATSAEEGPDYAQVFAGVLHSVRFGPEEAG
ncbi:hypothetical protein [Streptodolium elevatio]|uniref:Uncharacterized protein n=1 Tax=Streptodolium elevatio TaxID=3157996 RepID=A0ABV3DDX5_9ACTN